jgi:hypothetical protein
MTKNVKQLANLPIGILEIKHKKEATSLKSVSMGMASVVCRFFKLIGN